MKRVFVLLIICTMVLGCFACGKEEAAESPNVIARINDFKLTLDEFEKKLSMELQLDEDYTVSKEGKRNFLNQLIKKEILIQEAKRLKLDQREMFIRAIERHWEATLIKDLMELKSKEIGENIYVPEEDVKARYEKMKKEDPDIAPLEEIRETIVKDMVYHTESAKLEQWLEELTKKATVKINENLL